MSTEKNKLGIYCKNACEGSGFILIKTDKYPDGATARCSCLLREIDLQKFRKLYHQANMEHYKKLTFKTYLPEKSPLEKLVIEHLRDNLKGLYIFGPVGTGKTHLAAATVHEAIKRGIPSVMFSLPAALRLIALAPMDEKQAIEKTFVDIPYLVLDDLGKEKTTDTADETLFRLIDERWKRHQAGHGNTTITTNIPPEALKIKYDVAVVDRIKGMSTDIFMDGESRRGK